LDPRITFRRGTPGTYYDGVTHAKAEENLIDYSEDFANAYWRVNQITITTGHSSPDGGSTARKLAPTSGTSNKFIEIESGGSQNDFPDLGNLHFAASVFAKAGEKKYIKFATVDTNLTRRNDVIVDLSDGSIIESINNDETQYSVQSAGGDWYRIGITGFGMQQLQVLVLGDDLSTNAAGDGTSGIYLWGAQLEQRDSVTSYTATNGSPITKYQPKLMTAAADTARFDHDPITGESKGLLIEESRTNLFTYSEDFDNGWVKVRLEGIETDAIIAPDGKLSGEKYIQQDGNGDGGNLHQVISLTSGTTYTSSVYAKKGQFNQIRLLENNVNNSVETTIFSLDDGTLVSQSAYHDSYSITDIGNGWYRFSITFTASGTANSLVGFYLHDSSDVTGNGYKGTYIWGAQFETGSFATSYIKTTGASATRSADNASITGENFSSWYRQDEGSIYVDSAKGNLGTNFAGYVSLHTEDFSDSEYYWLLHNSSDQFQFLVAPGIASLTDGIDASLGSQKACVSWADDNFYMSVNGGAIQADTEGPAKKNLTGLRIGFSPYSNSHYLNSTIKKLAYYPQRLTNEQLQNLTK